MKNQKAFTLIEIAVAAIIIGILVLVGIPNFLKTTQRGYALDAMRNLMAMYAAQSAIKDTTGNYVDCSLTDSNNECNTKLDTHINLVGNTTYGCSVLAGVVTCTATGTAPFTMKVSSQYPITIGSNPVYCTGGNPSATSNPCCTGGVDGKACP